MGSGVGNSDYMGNSGCERNVDLVIGWITGARKKRGLRTAQAMEPNVVLITNPSKNRNTYNNPGNTNSIRLSTVDRPALLQLKNHLAHSKSMVEIFPKIGGLHAANYGKGAKKLVCSYILP